MSDQDYGKKAETMFARYRSRLKEEDILGDSPTKGTAIRFCEKRPFDGVSAIRNLFDTLSINGWNPPQLAGTNWKWRDDKPTFKTRSPEVILERTVVLKGNTGTNEWTWQMSTASGVEAQLEDKRNASNKRAAIDLVRNNGNGSFTFVELKVGSDNPLYALFELLGYALAYLQARKNGWGEYDPENEIFKAREIKLVVLGPEDWYKYKRRGSNAEHQIFNLDWMLPSLVEGLNLLSKGNPTFSIAFETFRDPVELAAEQIISSAPGW